ncbi:MAG: hypothetical protein GF411_20040 [Candidatus Lokiarchaeota archaeon]|nr:hypothetical protein [Candidatus Lokiarchaeota archaeon]
MRFKIIFLFSFVFLLVLASPTTDSVYRTGSDDVLGHQTVFSSAYTNHAAITITSDADFVSQGFPGSGNETHPYIIEGYYIDSSTECITIQAISSHYVIKDCYLTSTSTANNAALDLRAASFGTIENTYIENHSRGAFVYYSHNITFINTTVVSANQRGIDNDHSDSMMVNDSFFLDCTYAIYSRYNDYSVYFNNSFSTCENTGIYVEYSTNSVLNNSIDQTDKSGVLLFNSPDTSVSYNNITDCGTAAINIISCDFAIVQSNMANRCSILLENSANCTVQDNELIHGGVNIAGSIVEDWLHIMSGNTVNEKPLAYLKETTNVELDGPLYGQVIFADCENISVEDGIFDYSYTSSCIGFCNNVSIRNVSMISEIGVGGFGVYCYESSFCKIYNFSNSYSKNGIVIKLSNNCTLSNCTITTNTAGMYLQDIEDIVISDCTVESSSEIGIEIRDTINLTMTETQVMNCVLEGIWTRRVDDSVISDNTISGCSTGIEFLDNTNTNVTFNTIQDSDEYGIYIQSSDSCGFVNNTIHNSQYGFYMLTSNTCSFHNNTLLNNGLFIYGDTLDQYLHSVHDNKVNGKRLGYFVSLNDSIIDGTLYGQFIVINCSFLEITGGVADNASRGITAVYSDNCTLTGLSSLNNIENGFYLFRCQEFRIEDVTVENSDVHGFYLVLGSEFQIQNCTVVNSSNYGFWLIGCDDITLENTISKSNDADGYFTFDCENVTFIDANAMDNRDGMKFEMSEIITLTNCNSSFNDNNGLRIESDLNYIINGSTFSNNEYGIRIKGIGFVILENNTCNQNTEHGFYISVFASTVESNYAYDNGVAGFRIDGTGSVTNNTALGNEYGFYFQSSTFSITGNNGSENDYGFYLYQLSMIELENNSAMSNNFHGFYFDDSDHLNISGNTASGNVFNGLYFKGTTDCNVTENEILSNGIGIEFDETASGNVVYLNEFGFNSFSNAISYTSNNWNASSTGNYWSDYSGSGTYPIIGSAGDIDYHPMRMYQEPSINSPDDVTFYYGDTGYSITWEISITHPTEQELVVNGTSLGLESYSGDIQIIDLDDYDIGEYNLTLVIYDERGNSVSDTVIVTIIDDSPPSLSSPSDLGYEFSSENHNITWTVTKEYLGYEIYRNGSVIDVGPNEGNTITISIDGLAIGIHNYTIRVFSDFGEDTDTVYVEVEDTTSPTINSPEDIEYDEGETGNVIQWTPSDAAPSFYQITRNDTIVLNGYWNGSALSINIDHLNPGVYIYSLRVEDSSGHYTTDSVTVTVTSSDTILPTSTTTTSTTGLPTTPRDNAPLFLGIGLGAGILIGILLIAVVVPLLKE